jgi:hypothetical protein
MVVLGILLLLAAAALVVLLAMAGTSQHVVLDLVGGQQLTTSPVWIFVAGALALLLAELGLMLISRGTRRAVARRRELRRLRGAAEPEAVDVREPDQTEQRDQTEQPDRLLVRDVDELRARERLDREAPHRSPEETIDPEGGRHELRLDDRDVRERRP